MAERAGLLGGAGAGLAGLSAGGGEADVAAAVPAGRLGMWWFLASEIMMFGGLIGCYVLARVAGGGWEAEARHVSTRLGTLNTFILLTSSLTMVQAHAAVVGRQDRKVARYLLATVGLGLAFLVIKAGEYSNELAHGFTPARAPFWSFYYTLTGLHGLHVFAGIVVNSVLAVHAVRGSLWQGRQQRVELAGLYWHFVDIVWIFLFPLLYLT